MGISSSNLNFLDKINGCKIGGSVSSVSGLSSASASPSDQWILTLNGAFYGKRPIKKAFMKWFINPDDFKTRMKNLKVSRYITDHYLDDLYGLEYEIKVYRDIISPLIENHVCPNFVKFLADGDTCNREDITKILLDKTATDAKLYGKKQLSKESLDQNVNRNIAYIFTARENRPSINNDKEDISTLMNTFGGDGEYQYDDLREIIQTNQFQFLMTEAITNDNNTKTETLYEYMMKPFEMDDFYKIFFQMIFACYAMTQSGMNHMDMHSGNIYVEITKKPVEVIYVTDIHTYRFMTRHKVLIYDFDFSYVERLGDNSKMRGGKFNHANMTNENIYTRDIAKTSYFVWNQLHNINEDLSWEFLELIASDKNAVMGIIDVYKVGSFLQVMNGGQLTSATNWYNWADHNTVLSRIADTSYGEITKTNSWLGRSTRRKSIFLDEQEIKKSPPKNKHENVFVCSHRMFKKNGELDVQQTQKLFNEIKTVYKSL
jgi:hypothetical protein